MRNNTNSQSILTINGGSSSIKFALYKRGNELHQLFSGAIENIGTGEPQFKFHPSAANLSQSQYIKVVGHADAANYLIDFLENEEGFKSVIAIGYRVVHGMDHTLPTEINDELIEELKQISPYTPEHLPSEITLIEVFRKRFPHAIQIACFDTSFHSSMPLLAKLLPIPRRYYGQGIQRYGFHGLSYAWIMDELKRLEDGAADHGKIIIAHLGNGASMVAIKDGKSIDTSMGFTPTAGLMMGTRTGDLDPGLVLYLMETESLTLNQFSQLVNHQSGLLGVSEISADMRELIRRQHTDSQAAEAIELFCYQSKKWIGSFAAVLDGLDTLIFTGGIGENSPEVRERVCHGLTFLGIELNEKRNRENEAVISSENSLISVRVIKTNEELMIAVLVNKILNERE